MAEVKITRVLTGIKTNNKYQAKWTIFESTKKSALRPTKFFAEVTILQ